MSEKRNKLVPAGELQRQQAFAEQVKELMLLRTRNPVPLAHVHTYGCQGNVADGERIKGMLAQMGFEFTEEPKEADLILYNTCAIREHAEDRVFGNVGALKHIKERHPATILGLCGCMMQQPQVAERIRKSFPYVSLVFGTHVVHRLPELLYRLLTCERRVFELPDSDGVVAEGLPVRRDGELKAWLPIMYGCNNFCSYCIVPYVRGRERSRTMEAIVAEAKEIIAAGYKEITLLGQNVNSYGKDLPEPVSFAQLLRTIDALPGDFKIRFMTSHPKDATKELIDVIAESRKVSHHLHLPVQSGSNRILKAMNRHYTREQYLDLVAYAKKRIPDLSLTSDIIVGFPGETREDFEETLSLIKEVGYTSLFTFIFSPREGTPAAKMDDPIEAKEKSAWFSQLLKVQEEIAAKRSASMVGQVVEVLCEEEGKNGLLTGRTDGNIIIEFTGSPEQIGRTVNVKVTRARNWILVGEAIDEETKL